MYLVDFGLWINFIQPGDVVLGIRTLCRDVHLENSVQNSNCKCFAIWHIGIHLSSEPELIDFKIPIFEYNMDEEII